MTLSLSDMANRVQLSGPREAEKYILNMVGRLMCHVFLFSYSQYVCWNLCNDFIQTLLPSRKISRRLFLPVHRLNDSYKSVAVLHARVV